MSRIKSSSQHTFAQIPRADIPRSSFKRNSNYKTTLNAGYLVPIFLDEVLPGDTFNLSITSFARILSPLKYPILDNLYMDYQFFFIPTRLVYADYEKFFGSSKGPEGNWEYDDSHLMPQITAPTGGFTVGSVADYFGIPTGVAGIKVNALPFRAYNRVIADWYLPSSYGLDSPVCLTDYNRNSNGDRIDDVIADYPLRKRLKRCDAFTAALPEPQRGPGIEMPLGSYAPVVGNGNPFGLTSITPNEISYPDNVNVLGYNFNETMGNQEIYRGSVGYFKTSSDSLKVLGANMQAQYSGLRADLSRATAVTINSLRQGFQLQRWLERDERGGVQYVSTLLSHFGVRSPDARLQRTEYLGGGSTPIQIHSVANTTSEDSAKLSAFGLSATGNVGFIKSFTEHGYVIGLVSVRADNTYQQGIPKLFDRFARFDYYWPVFAHLGEEVIKNKSIYAQGNSEDDEPFGYQERYWDYRYSTSKITGQLRSTYEQTLDSWHLAQKFNNLPKLNQEFLEVNVPMNRVKAVTTAPDFLYDSLIRLNCVRPMSLFGVPGLVDHF